MLVLGMSDYLLTSSYQWKIIFLLRKWSYCLLWISILHFLWPLELKTELHCGIYLWKLALAMWNASRLVVTWSNKNESGGWTSALCHTQNWETQWLERGILGWLFLAMHIVPTSQLQAGDFQKFHLVFRITMVSLFIFSRYILILRCSSDNVKSWFLT